MNSIVAITIFCLFMFAIITMINGLRLAIVESKLISWLKENKYERWRYLTSIRLPFVGIEIGPGLANSFRANKYFNSELDNDDKQVFEFKSKMHRLSNSTKNYMLISLFFAGILLLLYFAGVK